MAVPLLMVVALLALLPRWWRGAPHPAQGRPAPLRVMVQGLAWAGYAAAFVFVCFALAELTVYLAFLFSGGRL